MMKNSSWRILTNFEISVIRLLWEADLPNTSHFISRIADLRARSTGVEGCISLAFVEQINLDRPGRRTFPYVAEAQDVDRVPIEIILMDDSNGDPFELEIMRLDGGNLITLPRIENLIITKIW